MLRSSKREKKNTIAQKTPTETNTHARNKAASSRVRISVIPSRASLAFLRGARERKVDWAWWRRGRLAVDNGALLRGRRGSLECECCADVVAERRGGEDGEALARGEAEGCGRHFVVGWGCEGSGVVVVVVLRRRCVLLLQAVGVASWDFLFLVCLEREVGWMALLGALGVERAVRINRLGVAGVEPLQRWQADVSICGALCCSEEGARTVCVVSGPENKGLRWQYWQGETSWFIYIPRLLMCCEPEWRATRG